MKRRSPGPWRRCCAALFALLLCLSMFPWALASVDALPTEEPLRTAAPAGPTATPCVDRACRAWPTMEAPTPEPRFSPRTATIRAVGDLMMHKKQLDIARQPDGTYSFDEQYAFVVGSLSSADYTIGNLETTVGPVGKEGFSGYPRFNAPEAMLEAVKDSGIDFLTLANNHMLDRYFDGMVQTVSLVEKHGFDFGGANRSQAEMDAPNVVEVNGIKLGMLCYAQHTNGMERHSSVRAKEYGINYLGKADFAADVKKLRDAGAEVVIAIPHWGAEYERQPGTYALTMARRMAEAGVDVILGSHPHVVQPVRFLEVKLPSGEAHRTLVAYSLGNFISNMSRPFTDMGIILEFTLVEKGTGGFSIEDVGYVPVYCWRSGKSIQSLPAPKYLDSPPAGMSSTRVSQMRSGCQALQKLIGSGFPQWTE